jgi:hypothetical protein
VILKYRGDAAVHLDRLVFFFRKFPVLAYDAVGDADFSDVVQLRSPLDIQIDIRDPVPVFVELRRDGRNPL